MRLFRHPPEHSVLALLAECGLPTLDLVATDFDGFLGCGSDGRLDGVVGLEFHGADALLRSLAVATGSRCKGCGRALVEGAQRLALAHGIETLASRWRGIPCRRRFVGPRSSRASARRVRR